MAGRVRASVPPQRTAAPHPARGKAAATGAASAPAATRRGVHRIPHPLSAWQNGAGNAASTRALQRAPEMQRMTYPGIKPLAGVKPATEARLAQIAQVASIVPSDDVATIFKKLGDYGRSNFQYDSGAESLANALGKNTFNCETLSDLFIVMTLMVKDPQNLETKKVTDGNPILYRGSLSAGGCSNQVANVTGKPWVFYSGGHTIASVEGTMYDLTTGVIGGFSNSNYLTGQTLGNKRYRFMIDGTATDLQSNSQVLGGLYGADVVPQAASGV